MPTPRSRSCDPHRAIHRLARPLLAPLALAPLVLASSVLASSGLAARPLHAQVAPTDDPPSVGTGTVVGQVALGTVGTAVGFVGGGLATRWVARRTGATEEGASRAAWVGAWTGAALTTPVGPVLLGSRDGVRGSYPAAVGGAVAGGLASWLVVTAGRRGAFDCGVCRPVRVLAAVSAFVLPSVGATIAFNATREAR